MEGPGAWTRDPLTLRFLDARLEREFQTEMAATNGPQMRVGAAVAVGLWLLAALIIPTAIVIDRSVVSVICVGMAVANLVGVVATALGHDARSPAAHRLRAERPRRSRRARPDRGLRSDRPIRRTGAAAHRHLRVRRHPPAVRVRARRRRDLPGRLCLRPRHRADTAGRPSTSSSSEGRSSPVSRRPTCSSAGRATSSPSVGSSNNRRPSWPKPMRRPRGSSSMCSRGRSPSASRAARRPSPTRMRTRPCCSPISSASRRWRRA